MNAHILPASEVNTLRDSALVLGLLLGLLGLQSLVARPVVGQPRGGNEDLIFPVQHFTRALVSSSVVTRSSAINRIEREFAGDPQAMTTVLSSLKRVEGDARHRAAAIDLVRLLLRMDHPDLPSHLIDLLQSPDHRVVMLALDGLLRLRHVEAVDPIFSLADRPEFESMHGFRVAVLEALMTLRDPKAMEFLIEWLPNLRGESAALVVDYLSDFTDEDLGDDPIAWQRWWRQSDRSHFGFDKVPSAIDESESMLSQTEPYFFGLPVRAKRLVFVVDQSTSMSERLGISDRDSFPSASSSSDVEAATSRLARAQQELTTVISELPEDSLFNIVVFDSKVSRWQRGLVPATANYKASALRFVANTTASGETASFDALENTFSLDPNLEAIYFLSDGVPTVGRIVPAPDIIHAVSTENFFRRISIHTIGIGVSRLPDRFLRKLAERNRGEYRAIGTDLTVARNLALASQGASVFAPRKVFTPPMSPILTPRAQPGNVATKRLKDDELVLGVTVDGHARAYPLNMLTGPNREIINDEIGGRPIAATWCHLAHCATIYDRRINNQTLTLTVSGMLWNETLVMMDTATRSLWAQLTGEAESGVWKGQQLTRLPSVVTDWASWYEQHPETTVTMLSRTAKQFNVDAFSILSNFVVGAADGDQSRAWALDELLHQPAVNDVFNDQPVLVTLESGSKTANVFQRRTQGQVLEFEFEGGRLTDKQTGSSWDLSRGVAIAGPLRGESLTRLPFVVAYHENWTAFHPATSFWGE